MVAADFTRSAYFCFHFSPLAQVGHVVDSGSSSFSFSLYSSLRGILYLWHFLDISSCCSQIMARRLNFVFSSFKILISVRRSIRLNKIQEGFKMDDCRRFYKLLL